MLLAACSWTNRGTREIVQQVTTDQVQDGDANITGEALLGAWTGRKTLTDLETMGLVETWVESQGSDGRVKYIETPFDPEWVEDAVEPYVDGHTEVELSDDFEL